MLYLTFIPGSGILSADVGVSYCLTQYCKEEIQMKRKTCLSILLVLAMLFSLAIIGGASAFAVDSSAKPKEQIKLIASKFDVL